MTEKEINLPIPERELTQCSWCGETDNKKKFSASPGDDLENPRLYHEECFEALRFSWFLAMSNRDNQLDAKKLTAEANAWAGIKKKKK